MTERPTAADPLERLLRQARRAKEYYVPTIDPAASARARVEVGDFVRDRLAELRADAAGSIVDPATPGLADEPLTVWTYWDGPERDAPPLVRACLAQLRIVHPDARILDAAAARELVPLPPLIEHRLADRPAHRSDLIRVSLLERHGGIWVDATAYVPAPLTGPVTDRLRAGAIYLRWGGQQISNWFIAARRGNPLIALQRAALTAWWAERDELPDYFLYHRLHEALVAEDDDARGVAKRMPRVSTIPSHLLQLAMLRPYDADLVRLILGAAMLQKLSYKYDAAAVPPESILARLVDRGLREQSDASFGV
ncbi:capsular polysaccharide synthesis protein [Agromyces bauzanensis]